MLDANLAQVDEMLSAVAGCAPHEAADLLERVEPALAVAVLQGLNPMVAQQALDELEEDHRTAILAAAAPETAAQWRRNQEYEEDSVGWLMEPPVAVFRPTMRVREAIDALRRLTKKALITYGYVTDDSNKLLGVLVMRDLMLAEPEQLLSAVMLDQVFWLSPEMELTTAMKSCVNRHYPVYPVCDPEGHLLGLVRGSTLFEARAIEISAQAGTMVGVEKEERLSTPVWRSLLWRHPWLQANLLTCFVAGAVVAFFQGTLDRVVLLAAFLPVMSGQSGNTGCQALAVALRGLTLGELKPGEERRLIWKEALLGLINGALVGVTAGLGMWAYAHYRGNPNAVMLGVVVLISMLLSCVISGVTGAYVPLLLRKFGADPATASSIILTTATDVMSMGIFLGLATWLGT